MTLLGRSRYIYCLNVTELDYSFVFPRVSLPFLPFILCSNRSLRVISSYQQQATHDAGRRTCQ